MMVLDYVNQCSRRVYQVQKELEENDKRKASFDFSLITAFSSRWKCFLKVLWRKTIQEKPKEI
jgi:hypothetical protein